MQLTWFRIRPLREKKPGSKSDCQEEEEKFDPDPQPCIQCPDPQLCIWVEEVNRFWQAGLTVKLTLSEQHNTRAPWWLYMMVAQNHMRIYASCISFEE